MGCHPSIPWVVVQCMGCHPERSEGSVKGVYTMIQAEKPEQVLPTAAVSLGKPKREGKQATSKNNWWIYTLLTLGLIIMIVPFVWMILSSLKGPAELGLLPASFLPLAPTMVNYANL